MLKHYYLRVSSLIVNHAILLLSIVHVVGIVGLLSPVSEYFRLLTPFTLILSGFVLWLGHRDHSKDFYFFALFVFAFGFVIEFLGVRYGILFGNYAYGSSLGPKLMGVPVIIGLNWLLIIYCVGALTESLNLPITIKILLGSALAIAIDWLIEPVAMQYDFWTWKAGVVPIQNYLGWFFTSSIMLAGYHLLKVRADLRMALPYYFIQVFFFLIINLAIR